VNVCLTASGLANDNLPDGFNAEVIITLNLAALP